MKALSGQKCSSLPPPSRDTTKCGRLFYAEIFIPNVVIAPVVLLSVVIVLFPLMLQRLTVLDASANEIGVLPTKMGDLKWLRVTRLSRNHIVDMQPLVTLTGCEELDLSQNEIAQIPDTISHMTSLVALDLSHNGLTQLPHAICSVSTPCSPPSKKIAFSVFGSTQSEIQHSLLLNTRSMLFYVRCV